MADTSAAALCADAEVTAHPENFYDRIIEIDLDALEARMLDLLLVLQAEHGGGNNSTFTVRVTSSTRTDTYSSIAAGIGSLKGPLHGGANIQVVKMFHYLKEAITDWTNVDEIDTYLTRMLNKEAYDRSGLIYGIGTMLVEHRECFKSQAAE